MSIAQLRRDYHRRLCTEVIRISGEAETQGYPNFADGSNKGSVSIAWGILKRLGCLPSSTAIPSQTAGDVFEAATKSFLEEAFQLLAHLRPGKWLYSTVTTAISGFEQYRHLADLARLVQKYKEELESVLGTDYIIAPDIVVGRFPVSDADINAYQPVIEEIDPVATLTPIREQNHAIVHPLLHAQYFLQMDYPQ